MRGVAILATAAAIYSGAHDAAQAQTSAVVTPTPGLSTPVTSTTTNCMMSCMLSRRTVKQVASFRCRPRSRPPEL